MRFNNNILAALLIILILIALVKLNISTQPPTLVTGKSTDSSTVGFEIIAAFLESPTNLTAILAQDNQSINLDWNPATGASTYTVYYSNNFSEIINLNPDSLTSGTINITGITDSNWTDSSAYLSQYRFYRVASVSGSEKNLSEATVGKADIYLRSSTSATPTKGRNLVSLAFNITITAEEFVSQIPPSYNPYIARLSRDNHEEEIWKTHPPGSALNNFTLGKEEGYLVYTEHDYNNTIVGQIFTRDRTIEFIASTTASPVKGRNLMGIPNSTIEYTAEQFITGIPSAYNPYVSRLSRDDPEQEEWKSHPRGSALNDFTMYPELGYLTYLEQSYNHTI